MLSLIFLTFGFSLTIGLIVGGIAVGANEDTYDFWPFACWGFLFAFVILFCCNLPATLEKEKNNNQNTRTIIIKTTDTIRIPCPEENFKSNWNN